MYPPPELNPPKSCSSYSLSLSFLVWPNDASYIVFSLSFGGNDTFSTKPSVFYIISLPERELNVTTNLSIKASNFYPPVESSTFEEISASFGIVGKFGGDGDEIGSLGSVLRSSFSP